MSRITQFPDAIVFPDGTIRLVTTAAKSVADSNTNIRGVVSLGDDEQVPDYLHFDCSGPELLEDEGLAVKREQMPLGLCRSKQRRWPKPADSDKDNVISFSQNIPEDYRNDAMFRAYGKHRKRHHEKQQKEERTGRPFGPCF